MVKKILKLSAFLIAFTLMFSSFAFAEDEGETGIEKTIKSKKVVVVDSPSKCHEQKPEEGNELVVPVNCLFLEEPIGGKPNYDLYLVTCTKIEKKDVCTHKLWGGGAIPKNAHGPVQAVLTFDPDKPYQGPFGLLYNYLGLIYTYMSGLIVAIAVLFTVIGGIQMTTAGGDTAKFDAGKSRITKAIVGIILWFTASLILYTINPTFFAF